MRYPSLTASQLRRELNARAEAYARAHHLLHEISPGPSPSVIFGVDPGSAEGRHGNFHPEAYARIATTPEWARRLAKPHTASRRSRARKDWRWMELDAAVSSDALLMSVFCHPGVWDGRMLSRSVAALLDVDPESRPEFGQIPGIPLAAALKPRSRRAAPREALDRTEVDLVLGPADPNSGARALFVEAKLTEASFQAADARMVERYRDLGAVFDIAQLPVALVQPPPLAPNVDPDDPTVNLPRRASRTRVAGYQLIRNVLAAWAADAAFCVLVDARRHDLIEQWFAVLRAVHAPDFRWRLKLLTWQELACALPEELRRFLAEKYGIV